jgi:UDP-glucose 4-epimerase
VRVLVTGGAGYIGSVTAERLLGAGHAVAVLDNLSRGHRGAVPSGVRLVVGDVRDRALVTGLLREERIDCVMHFSAASLVGESMQDPGEYFGNNVVGMVELLRSMVATGVGRIIFSSTAATYGEPAKVPITEDEPVHPTNPYGESKAIAERMLGWFRAIHGIRFAALRYFNAAGATRDHGEDHAPETHLIPLALRAAAGEIGRPMGPVCVTTSTSSISRRPTSSRSNGSRRWRTASSILGMARAIRSSRLCRRSSV